MKQGDQPDPNRTAGTQAVHRALSVLHVIARGRDQGVALSSICQQSGLNKSTAHRLASALVAAGMVEQDAQTRLYFLGVECHALGLVAAARFGLHHDVDMPVRRLAQHTGDAAFFSVRQGAWSLCLLRHEGNYPLKSHVLQAGDRHPLGVGGGSLSMLAALADAEIDQVLAAVMDEIRLAFPGYTRESLLGQVAATRRQGFAVNRGQVLKGSWGFGVPVRNPEGQVIGAYSIATVESRVTPEREQFLGDLLAQEARALEQILCARASAPGLAPVFFSSAAAAATQSKRHHHDASSHRRMVTHPLRETV